MMHALRHGESVRLSTADHFLIRWAGARGCLIDCRCIRWMPPPEVEELMKRSRSTGFYREWLYSRNGPSDHLPQLRGSALLCDCPADAPACHADALVDEIRRRFTPILKALG